MGRWIAAAGLTWVTLLAGAMTPQTQGNTSQAIAEPEAYAVIASILPTEWLISFAHAKTLVVQSETPASWPCALDHNPPDPDWRMAFGAFRAELGKVRSWQAGFALGLPYVVASRAEIDGVLRQGWNVFAKRFPDSGGFLTVSVIGFDAQKTRAVFAVSHACGMLCGGGSYRFLEKVESHWRTATGPGLAGPYSWASYQVVQASRRVCLSDSRSEDGQSSV